MAGEDYIINGENISKIAKRKKVGYGNVRWYNLLNTYDIKVIKENNNLILFSIEDKEYYYGVPSQKIRRKGDTIWSSKIITELKKDFGTIPIRKESTITKYTPESLAPGKHKDKTWIQVSQEDPGYIKWMIDNTKDKELKNMLEGI